jgi:carbon-monoxide dehydrogenase medium subunit
MTNFFRPREYYRPDNLEEAARLLSTWGKKAKPIAGGTDLLVAKSPGVECLVDVGKLNLSYIREDGHGIAVGAATTVDLIERSPILSAAPYAVLQEAATGMATPTVRNRATIGGNLCNASPAADLPLPLLVLDSTLIVAGLVGKKEIPLTDFFTDVNCTALEEGEMLTEIHIPLSPGNAGACFLKLRRHQTAVDIAVVNVGVLLVCREGVCERARIAMGAVAPTPVRAKSAEDFLTGKEITGQLIQEVAEGAAAESKPIGDLRASAVYRKRMVAVLVKRALQTALGRCR